MGKHSRLTIEIIDGKIAPRYHTNVRELMANKAVITSQGTVNDNPIVDIQMSDANGNEYFFSLTGAIFQNLAAAIEGAKARKHETSDKPTS